MTHNLLLLTDVYKYDHAAQYPLGTNKIYSYFCARKASEEYGNETVFFGLQYYLKEYLKPITKENVDEFKETVDSILGAGNVNFDRFYALAELGYLPIEIKAVREGEIVGVQNALFTITNTHPDYFWLVNYIETLLLKVWYPMTVATISHNYRKLCSEYADKTCNSTDHLPFQIHDFGYRAVSSEESAGIGGAAHLLNFMGTDTTAGVSFLRTFYNGQYPIGLSVPASEHSVMCAHSPDNNDFLAIRNMLETYPKGIVSIVSDTYDLWRAVGWFCEELQDEVLARDGKVVIRPDSGDPEKIFLGDPEAPIGPVRDGLIESLWNAYGGDTNAKGFKVLNPKIGTIYGDAIYFARAKRIFEGLQKKGFASSNVVFGIGGILLQGCTRDTFGVSLKATYCEVNGVPRAIMKAPKTDSSKNSHKGLLQLERRCYGGVPERVEYTTWQEQTWEEEADGHLKTVYKDGMIYGWEVTLEELRKKLMV
jgi:nicotinamide phosphoribosyltransferase